MAQRQRKGKPVQTGGGNKAFYAVLGVIALAGVAAIVYALMGSGGGAAATDLVEVEVANAQELFDQATPVRLGSSDAPVKIVEFGDFQCPACGDFSLQVRPYIKDRYVKSGQVQFIFYDFPLAPGHQHAVVAARAARCAGAQELPPPAEFEGVPGELNASYWIYHDKLFEAQRDWAYEQGSVVDELVDFAGEVGLDEGEFESCLRSDQFADVVSANRMLGEQVGVNATPTVIVNNRRVENWRPQNLARIVEESLGNAAGAGSAGDGD